MYNWETYPKPVFIPWSKREISGSNSEIIFLSTHTGTHIDAPFHMENDGKKINDFPIEKFYTKAILYDFTWKKSKEFITEEDLKTMEDLHGEIHEGEAVILYTGWSKKMEDPSYSFDEPGLSKKGAEYLVKKKASIVGIDADSMDNPLEEEKGTFPAHDILLSNDILIVERLCNLDQISKKRFIFSALPLRLKDTTGSPIRAIAIEEKNS